MSRKDYLPGGSFHHGAWYPHHVPEDIVDYITHQLRVSSDDIIIAGYPKSGTTWTEEITSLLCHNGDVEEARKLPIYERVISMEVKNNQSGIAKIEAAATPRIMKTHLPYTYLRRIIENDQPKVIYVVRNPKDTLVSYYHFHRMTIMLDKYEGTWQDFFQVFKEKRMAMGDWFDHVTGWWEESHRANILVVKYEDLLTQQRDTIATIARFLEKDVTEDILDKIVDLTSFQSMKSSSSTNYSAVHQVGFFDFNISPFMRKGQLGDWKNYFTGEQSEYVDARYQSTLAGLGLDLRFE